MIKCRANKHKHRDNIVYVAISKSDGTKFYDIENRGGFITSYIRNNLGIEVPSLYFRKKYKEKYGKEWWEQWFDIIPEVRNEVKKCPFCEWETFDINNKSGAFMNHLKKIHNMTVEEYLTKYPNEKEYFSTASKKIEKKEKLNDKHNHVLCPLCGEKFYKLTLTHIERCHNMTFNDFKNKFPDIKICSDLMHEQAKESQKLSNLHVTKNRFISKMEIKVREFLDSKNISYETNRQILIGKELDIYIPSVNIAIEINGLKWHTEWFGKKNHRYHLDKTLLCNNNGVGLIHIFEDELVNSEKIVFAKLKHILNIKEDSDRKIFARKCIIKQIYKHDAQIFLDMNHIQGFSSSSLYFGAFCEDELVAVMSFKNGNLKNSGWELTRFATKIGTICPGIGGKLFKYFIKQESPYSVHSFADRRWTIDINNNLYTKIGFNIEKIGAPDYKYYNERIDRYKRVHKMMFNKNKLHKKYGFPLTMTETEMCKEMGYDRIWDCGLIKYVWKNKE